MNVTTKETVCFRRLLSALVVFIVVALFYWPAMRHSFVNYDDNDYVLYNPQVLEGLSAKGVAWAATSVGYAWNWHPLTWLSLMTDVSISGSELRALRSDEPFPHPPHPEPVQRMSAVMHGHNVLLHAANAALLFLLMMVLCERAADATSPKTTPYQMLVCALAAGIWAVHPLRAEAVCWISERKELLCAFWSLLAIIAHLRCRRAWLAIVCIALAVAAKPVAVTLPAVMWALDLVFAGAVRWRRLAVYAAISLAGCALTLVAQRGNMADVALVPLKGRIVNALAAPAIYLWQTVWPSGLVHFYPVSESAPLAAVVVGGALWVLGVTFCLRALMRPSNASGLCVLASCWCLVCLLPMSGIVQVGSQLHADRYTYWIGCGLTACAAMAILGAAASMRLRARAVVLAVLAVALVSYSVCGFRQAAVWCDSGTLLKHAYESSDTAKSAADWAEYLVAEDPAAAERVYRASLARGTVPPALSGLAFLLAVQPNATDFAEAKRLAGKALALDGAEHRARVALGICAIREGRMQDAEKLLSEAVAEDASDSMASGLLRQVRARCTPAGK